jgi:hypothetical protein
LSTQGLEPAQLGVLLVESDGSSSSSWWGFQRKFELGDVTSLSTYVRGKKSQTDSAMLSNLVAAAAAAAAVAAPAAPPLPYSPRFSFRPCFSSLLSSPSTIARRTRTPSRLHPPDSIGARGRRRREPHSGGGGGGEQLPARAPLNTMRRERSWISEEPRLSVKIKSTLDQARPRLTTTTTRTAQGPSLDPRRRQTQVNVNY